MNGSAWWWHWGYLGSSGTPITAGDKALMETGDFILLETGDKILLEA